MSLFQRVPDPANEARTYSPLFHFLEDYSYHARKAQYSARNGMSAGLHGAWTPSFDVRETIQAYEVRGDLPGISNENLTIEFTGENTLSISGHKDRRSVSSTDSGYSTEVTPEEEQEAWQQTINNIDAATTGPLPGARRTSIVDASTWAPPAENIDQATFLHPGESQRRPSLRDARSWQAPAETIDAYSHAHVPASQRQPRRPSVVNARNWQHPPESIDGAITGPVYDPAGTLLAAAVKPFAFPRTVAEDHIDAATIGARRSATTVAGPWVRPSSRRNSPPMLLEERPAGGFAREIKFPTAVDREGVTASLKDGVLKVTVPKRPVEGKMRIAVSVL